MFNEKNPIWIKIYKIAIIVTFVACLVTAIVLPICSFNDAELLMCDDYAEIEALILFVAGVITAFATLASNMIILQFLNNVQVIREKLDNK